MSKLAEILKIENAPRESPVQKRTMRLVKMGAFLRAYDWSAWSLKGKKNQQEKKVNKKSLPLNAAVFV